MEKWNELKIQAKRHEKLLELQLSEYDVEGQVKLRDISDLYNKFRSDVLELKSLKSKNELLNTTINKAHLSRWDKILQEYKSKLNSLTNKKSSIDRDQLFGHIDPNSFNGSEQDVLLRERFSLHSSKNQVENLLNEASNGLGSLRRQRHQLGGVGTRLVSIGDMFPALGTLMKKIKDKKTRDNYVLALTIAFCLSLIAIYELHSWGL